MSLQDARILVVGGGSGIGYAVARAAKAEGAAIVIASTNADKLAAAAERLGGADTARIDITNSGVDGVDTVVDVPMVRAQEIGRFEMGSTVVLILPPGSARWTVRPGQPVRLGERIAEISG